MASGHEYRANRPNTWLLRPLLQSEDSSCQPGAVHTWPISTKCSARSKVGFWGHTGNDLRCMSQLLAPSRSMR